MLKKKSRKQNSSSLDHLLLWWWFQPLGNAERGVQSPGGSRSETGFTPVCPELRWVCSWLLLRVWLQGLWSKEGEGICSLYFLLMKIYQGDLSLIGMIFFKFYFDLWRDHGYQPLPVLNFNGGCGTGVTVSGSVQGTELGALREMGGATCTFLQPAGCLCSEPRRQEEGNLHSCFCGSGTCWRALPSWLAISAPCSLGRSAVQP